jgi:hypothetical protein
MGDAIVVRRKAVSKKQDHFWGQLAQTILHPIHQHNLWLFMPWRKFDGRWNDYKKPGHAQD